MEIPFSFKKEFVRFVFQVVSNYDEIGVLPTAVVVDFDDEKQQVDVSISFESLNYSEELAGGVTVTYAALFNDEIECWKLNVDEFCSLLTDKISKELRWYIEGSCVGLVEGDSSE